MTQRIHIFGGGTVQYVRSHMALCAPAYGTTARKLHSALLAAGVPAEQVVLHLTKMADYQSSMETNEDVAARVGTLIDDPTTRAIVFNVALCDFGGQIDDVPSGKYAPRLQSRDGDVMMRLQPAPKVLKHIKELRPDIMVVGFKTTSGDIPLRQVELAERQIAECNVDLVWANDTVTRQNLLVSGKDEFRSVQVGSREQLLMLLTEALEDLV